MSNCATKKKKNNTTGVETSKLAAKIDFIALKAVVHNLDINKLVNVPISLDNLKNKDDLHVGKLKSVPVDLRKLSDVVDNKVLKKTKFNKLNTKVNN